mgnify:CR=1 FL=1
MRALPLLLLLCACSGGGGGGVGDPPPPATTPSGAVSGLSPFTPSCGGTGGTSYVNAEVEPYLAVNPRAANHLVAVWQQDRWSNGSARGLLAALSLDGGATWTLSQAPFAECNGGTAANGGAFLRATDPWVTFSPDGTAYQMALATNGSSFTAGSSNAMTVSRSSDGGRTWSNPVSLITDGGAFFNDKNAITADPHDARFVYAVWDRLQQSVNGPAYFARTTDGGATWEPARSIYDPGTQRQTIGNLIREMGIRRPVYRLLFAGLDRASVAQALDTIRPLDFSAAIPGTARRIADRLIGSGVGDVVRGGPVGRVQSALLALSAPGVPHSHVSMKLPAADGGKPFLGKIPVVGARSAAELIAELGSCELPPAEILTTQVVPMNLPMNYGDAVLGLNSSLDVSVERAAELLQQMYEAGDISYPRTHARAFTGAGLQSVERLARLKGILTFKKNSVPVLSEPTAQPHEAIRVLNEALLQRLDLGKPMKLHATERDAALVLIARRSIGAGVPVQRAFPDLAEAPAWAHEIKWHRDTRRVSLPWSVREPPAVIEHDRAAAMVDAMITAAIGRPSTLVGHASKFLSRDLVDSQLRLTAKGRRLLDQAPTALKDVLTSSRIEALFDEGGDDVSQLVQAALLAAADNDHAAVEQIVSELENLDEDDTLENHYRPSF